MRAADLFQKYRQSINPPYRRKDLLTIGLTIFILLVIPLTVISANQARQLKSRAAPQVTKKEAQRSVPDEILLKFKPEVTEKDKDSLRKTYGLTKKSIIPKIEVEKVKVSPQTKDKTIEALKKNQNIEYAEPNFIGQVLETTPNDPSFSQQWGPQKVRAPAAWDITTGSSSVKVAVIDTGVTATHPDLAGKVLPGYDFANNDNDSTDDYPPSGHGTKVAGIIGAATNNAVGIAGLSWQSPILPVKTCCVGTDDAMVSATAEGVIYAADQGAKVMNISLGWYDPSPTLENAVNYAWNKNVVVVAASGNYPPSPIDQIIYPAAYPNVVAVGATGPDDPFYGNDVRTSFSCYGPPLDIVAPGEAIYGVSANGSYTTGSGTSFSSPHVAGAAALLWAAGASSNAAVVNALYRGAHDIDNSDGKHYGATPGWDQYYGWGRLDIYQSLQKLAEPPPTTDTDGDGFSDFRETYLGTDYNDACPDNLSDPAWPLDLDNNGVILTVGDVTKYTGNLFKAATDNTCSAMPGGACKRLDLDGNGVITTVGDVSQYTGKVFSTCQ